MAHQIFSFFQKHLDFLLPAFCEVAVAHFENIRVDFLLIELLHLSERLELDLLVVNTLAAHGLDGAGRVHSEGLVAAEIDHFEREEDALTAHFEEFK